MKPVIGLLLALVLLVGLSGCTLPGNATPTPTLPLFPPVASKAPPVNTLPPLPTFTKAASTALPEVATATFIPVKPTLTATSAPQAAATATKPAPTQPAATAKPAATSTKAATSVPASNEPKLFLIALNDNGASGKKIGCGDSLVGVTVQVADASAPLRGVLEQALALHNQTYGQSGLYNALFRSDLKLVSVTIQNGTAEIKLSGALTIGGTCDAPRVQAQLEEAALQFSTVQQVNITVNGVALKTLLSGK